MKNKIFAKLKQEYSSLGLGDEILLARAESLAATGLVTDDNVDAVVAVMKPELKELQKQNDRRVTDALEKERKKHEEELNERIMAEKKNFEDEQRKKEEESKAKAEEEAKALKEAEDAKRKAEDEAKAKAKADEEKKKLEESGNIPVEFLELLKREREEQESRIAAYDARLKKLMETAEEREKTTSASFESLKEQYKTLMETNNTLAESYNALKTENDEAKAQKAKLDRQNFILAKAKELGVPQWRVDEGFVIADDADEATISETIQKVANNIKTQQLPSARNVFPHIGNDEQTTADITELAKSIVK